MESGKQQQERDRLSIRMKGLRDNPGERGGGRKSGERGEIERAWKERAATRIFTKSIVRKISSDSLIGCIKRYIAFEIKKIACVLRLLFLCGKVRGELIYVVEEVRAVHEA